MGMKNERRGEGWGGEKLMAEKLIARDFKL